jgi:hypothetical protein
MASGFDISTQLGRQDGTNGIVDFENRLLLEQLEAMQCGYQASEQNWTGCWSSSGVNEAKLPASINRNAASEGAFSDRDARAGSEPRRLTDPDADVSAGPRMAMNVSKT